MEIKGSHIIDVMAIKELFTIFVCLILLGSCSNKKCKEAEEDARSKYKDPNLTGLWRYTSNYIETSSDSGYITFKPNGDYNTAANLKEINDWFTVWHSDNDIIKTTYCQDMTPITDAPEYKYSVKNDTLSLYRYSLTLQRFLDQGKTLVRVRKY